jgi:hypothetical protein
MAFRSAEASSLSPILWIQTVKLPGGGSDLSPHLAQDVYLFTCYLAKFTSQII